MRTTNHQRTHVPALPPSSIAEASWDFFGEMEDKLGVPITLRGGLNVRSSLWGQQSTSQHWALTKDTAGNALFTSVSTAVSTHQGAQRRSTQSTIGKQRSLHDSQHGKVVPPQTYTTWKRRSSSAFFTWKLRNYPTWNQRKLVQNTTGRILCDIKSVNPQNKAYTRERSPDHLGKTRTPGQFELACRQETEQHVQSQTVSWSYKHQKALWYRRLQWRHTNY